jgi:hypothetical protein
MNHLLKCLFVLATCLAVPLCAGEPPAIVPAVQQWQEGVGTVELARAPIVIAPEVAASLRPTAAILQEDLAALGFARPEIVVGEKPTQGPAIVLALTKVPFNVGPGVIEDQSYSMEITAAGVVILAHDRAGIYCGTRSLVQMLVPGDRAAPRLACGRIVDGPVTHLRMLMLDVGRKAFPIETLYDYLRVLGWYKMNVLHLHLSDSSFDNHYGGFRVQCDAFPGLTSKDCFYTRQQLRDFQDRAAAMGIMVLPEIDMPGHAAAFTMLWPELAWRQNPYAGNLDVNNPKTLERMKQVLDEVVPLFDAPYFHIGTDEYRVPYQDAAEREATGENFRKFINTMNAHIRSKGKSCVVWDGWEHVKGTIEIDPTVVVDMWWGIFDTNAYSKRGHKVINSCQNWSYLTSGRPTYGVNNAAVYNRIKPNSFGKVNLPMDDPNFLGTKLHVWVGQGPTGWTMTEIAGETFESLRALSETLWGKKGSADYPAFLVRAAPLEKVPGVTVLDRLPAKDHIILDKPEEIVMKKGGPAMPLSLETAARTELEFPWTLTMEIRKDEENGRGVILSSRLAEVAVNYHWDDRQKVVNAAEAARGKETFEKITRQGFGLIRATGNWKGENPTPADTMMAPENSRVYSEPFPCGRWLKVMVIAEKRRTRFFLDGQLVKEYRVQAICPLARLGSPDAANSFVGAIRNLRIYDHALTAKDQVPPAAVKGGGSSTHNLPGKDLP